MTSFRGRRAIAVNAAKLAGLASRAFGRGGGTALPGVVATGIDPFLTCDLARQLIDGSVVVSGTNGKTTTSRFLASILADAGYRAIRNESGSNLMRGVATSLVSHATLFGNLSTGDKAIGLFEIDEAALPGVIDALEPQRVLLLNLFRDQLDRYGEVATVARLWTTALASLRASSSVIVNADDPILVDTASRAGRVPLYFGIEMASSGASRLDHASDVKACPQCASHITYSAVYLGHLGHYHCEGCDFARPRPVVTASEVSFAGVTGSQFLLLCEDQSAHVSLLLPGMYNVYNAVAAAAVAITLGITVSQIAASLARTSPAFGRMERIRVDSKVVLLTLAKNPAGLNEVMRTLRQDGDCLHFMVMLNDNAADGRDVSWIWDADIEMLAGTVRSVVFSGTRAADMALRFKYAGVIGNDPKVVWTVIEDTGRALDHALSMTPPGGQLLVVPTYTAMLDIRSVAARRGYVRPYWEG